MIRDDARRLAERAEPGRAFTDAEIDAMLAVARAIVANPPPAPPVATSPLRLVVIGRAA